MRDRQIDIYICINVCLWPHLWGLSLGTGSGGKPCCQPSGWPARCGASSAGPHKIHFTKNIKLRARKKKVLLPNILRDFNLFHCVEWHRLPPVLAAGEPGADKKPLLPHKKSKLYNSAWTNVLFTCTLEAGLHIAQARQSCYNSPCLSANYTPAFTEPTPSSIPMIQRVLKFAGLGALVGLILTVKWGLLGK